MTRLLLLVLFLAASAGTASAQDWQLVWSDEFDYNGAPDESKWTFQTGGNGWGNNELQHYTTRLDNARVDGEHLVIEARKEDYGGNAYTSARLNSSESWTYGRYEIRAKLPTGRGTWPAIWMLYSEAPYGNRGWPDNGEIDIMEHVGYDPDVVHATVHTKAFNHRLGTQRGQSKRVPTARSEFNVYAIEWTPAEIRAYVNDDLYFTFANDESYSWPEWPFDHDFHLLLNLAVGGDWGGAQGVDDSVFPQEMVVDYVRVYEEVDPYPTVSLDGPSPGATVEAGGTVALAATASDGGAVRSVEFLQDGGLLGADTEAPYALDVENAADGCYSLTARATDDVGYVTETEPVEITVGGGCPEGQASPYLIAPVRLPGTLQAEYYDLGGPDVAYRDLSATNSGNGIRLGEGVDLRASTDIGGGYDLTDVITREWVAYTVDVEEAGEYRVIGRVASASGGTLRLALDGEDLLGDVSLSQTGGDEAYGNALLGRVTLPAGRHVLRIDMRSSGFSINSLSFSYVGSTAEEERPGEDLGLRLTPNPASSTAELSYTIAEPEQIEVSVFDVMGRRVARVAAGLRLAGEHATSVDVRALTPGVYTCVLTTETGAIRTERLVVVR